LTGEAWSGCQCSLRRLAGGAEPYAEFVRDERLEMLLAYDERASEYFGVAALGTPR